MEQQNTLNSIRSGYWESAGGNCWWIRQVGDNVYWMGMNKQSSDFLVGESWTHVGYGNVKDNIITINWADIPVGKDELCGQIEVEVISPTHIKVIKDSGEFGLSEWEWKNDKQRIENH